MNVDKMGPSLPKSANRLAENLRRVMARMSLTITEVARRTGLDDRTVKSMLRDGEARPHARTLHQLATGLGINVDELFQNPSLLTRRLFDRRTNPVVDEVIARQPHLFDGWSLADFDDLYSRFGTGGQLTVDGTLASVNVINRRRATVAKVALLLETDQADVVVGMIDLLYGRAVVCSGSHRSGGLDEPSRASATPAEDRRVDGDDGPGSAIGFGELSTHSRHGEQIGRAEMPANVAEK